MMPGGRLFRNFVHTTAWVGFPKPNHVTSTVRLILDKPCTFFLADGRANLIADNLHAEPLVA